MNTKDLEKMRVDYRMAQLDIEDVLTSPHDQLKKWLKEAMEAQIPEPNAMILATCNEHLKPSARVVLLKGLEDGGLIFYTNYDSRKGKELQKNPSCALVFNWLELQRQVRVEGTVERVSKEESAAYFHSRPRGSQLSGAVSPQSQIISNKEALEKEIWLLDEATRDKTIPMPDNWGGYIVKPHLFEFWQGRESRFHDRIEYHFTEGKWDLARLAP
jgi:pyridoxamine 5'-phosphate oxidase